MPDVSVVIPTYNRKEFLADAIASCFDGNDGIDVEVVVVDDHSTDGTRAFLDQLDDERVRFLTNPGSGAQTARNAGLEAAQGKTVRFLDDDDYFYPGALERQYRELVEEDVDVVYSDFDRVTGGGRVIETFELGPAGDLLEGLCESKIYGSPAPFLYCSHIAKKCRWRPEYSHFGDDMAYTFDIAAHNPEIRYLSSSVVCWRTHGGERLTDEKDGEPARNILRRRFRIVERAYSRRIELEDPHPALNAVVAQNLWYYARLVAPFDFPLFLQEYEKILGHFPGFQPKRSRQVFRCSDRLFGPVTTEAMLYFPRKLRSVLRS